MSVKELLDGLDEEQRKAVTLQTNGVVSAGAGSGKTRVLASRYAWLVMEKNLKPEEILTLTFTNKAVSEMYSRIYRYLLDQVDIKSSDIKSTDSEGSINAKAADALKNFHKARISTLDSFSANIARTAAARYGISPDFSSDDTALRDLAREAALRFVLDNREAPAIRTLLVDHKIRKLAEEIFAQVVLKYSPISSPLQLDKTLSTQKKAILKAWQENVHIVERLTDNIIDALYALEKIKKSIKFTKSLEDILLVCPPPPLPDIAPLLEAADAGANSDWDTDLPPSEIKEQVKKYFDYYSMLIAIRIPGNCGEVYAPLVEYFRYLKGREKDGLYHTLESIANYAFNFGLCSGIFELIEKFQDEFNAKKRETGFLSFNDIARLAVDALEDHPDIRKVYKDSIRMIMIDEFQDNNALQRDLIYLLAENSQRSEKGKPAPEELEINRMFFVGDEKQSIYRFRGADVAVFRSLGRDLFNRQGSGGLELSHNYRSCPGLIAAFNHIFGEGANSVFLPPGPEVPDYEAVYTRILPPGKTDDDSVKQNPLAHFCFLNAEELPEDDSAGIKTQDLEAVFIARKIRDMVLRKEKIPKRSGQETE
ncbi:MAG: UvrD-helicase domain-containing protein, partial [Treponema sp.]|nr:UvrD-helicase domain-containing protein [Treponema sp.]